jgi:hypothetical protein
VLRFFGATPREKPLFVETLTPVLALQREQWWTNNNNSQNANGNDKTTDKAAGTD